MLKKLLKKLVGSKEPEASQTPVIPAAPEKNFKNLRVKMSRPSKHRRFRFASFLMRRGVQVSLGRKMQAARLRGVASGQRQAAAHGAARGPRPDTFFKTSRVLLATAATPPPIFNAPLTVQKIPGSGKGRHAWGKRLSNKRGNSSGG